MNAETPIRQVYEQIILAWNERNAANYAALFADDANMVGFDGSIVDGKDSIFTHLNGIFTDHVTAKYVYKIREVRFLSPDSAILRAVVGMIPPNASDINPATSAIQSLVTIKQADSWYATLLQSTPAQFHGRPELAQALTQELRELL